MSKKRNDDDEYTSGLSDFTIFEPSEKANSDLRIDFPELGEESDFKDLQARELRWVWLVANRTSPLIKSFKDREKRCIAASGIVWGSNWEKNKTAVDLAYLNWPSKIIRAVERMVQFNPTVRLRARLMTEYALDQLQQIIIASPQDMKLMDPDSKKKYAELLLNVQSRLPELVNNMEKGYGVIIKKNKDDVKVEKITAAKLSNELGND